MPQIIPIKELKNTAKISEMCHSTNNPIYITKNGYGDMVIMSKDYFDRTMQKVILYNALEESERDIKMGKIRDAEKAIEDLRLKYEL